MRYLLLALLVMMPIALATGFDSYDVSYDASNSKVSIDTSIFLDNKTSGLDFSVFTKPENINVVSSVPISYKLDDNNDHKLLIDFIQPQSGNISLTITFNANIIESLSDREIFSFGFQAPLDIKDFSLKLLLPETSQVYYQDSQPLISPKPDILTDGKRIILQWKSSMKSGDSFIAVAAFTKPQSSFPVAYSLAALTIILAVAAFIIWKFLKKKSHKPIITSMSEDEREIFYLIRHQKGMTQEELRNKTGHSKSKISKLVRNLEKMDVIKKTPYKKTNKLESKL